MQLIPRELDKLVISQAGSLAQKRLARGVKLNKSEATVFLFHFSLLIRDGKHSVAELMEEGKTMLGRRHVLPHVAISLKEIQVEGTFPDGTYLRPLVDASEYEHEKQPGAVVAVKGPKIVLNDERNRCILRVTNKGDRPIQVGSHYHFIEVNPQLEFDRIQAFGYRLDIPAGTAIRFEPGDSRTVNLVQIGGRKIITGGNNVANGRLEGKRIPKILENLQKGGFSHVPVFHG
ncbi:unnamed protein product [Tuber melanosporum]|uniref:urease n=1 Tax=Tuber melanosporum (strain Mel28) TaxID=656061 RepID=D5G9W6_TUBMM|nr:uncharacterized protein GSTUM_00005103001 [Tuber melanosporum]CAZ81309.1 unnamed protein product [Tuber melanosporum]